jgi:small GTP-binding protein
MIQKKVCMVGVFGTGKTSLVQRFVHSMFSERYLSTVGVKIDRKAMQMDGADLTLVLWDLAGRDGHEDITSSYLRGAHAILYVADGTRRETSCPTSGPWPGRRRGRCPKSSRSTRAT